jgi:hypothetical protein
VVDVAMGTDCGFLLVDGLPLNDKSIIKHLPGYLKTFTTRNFQGFLEICLTNLKLKFRHFLVKF